jgi:hypothetical protein
MTFMLKPRLLKNQHDCLQEEGRIQSRNGTSKQENLALITRTRRGRRFTFPTKGALCERLPKDQIRTQV